MPTLTINGQSVTVDPGTSVLVAAKKVGHEIPHFCWHPYLTVAGNCRMCLVDVEKQPKLAIACNTVCADGMVVHTQSDKVKQAVQGVLEFELINHPIDCPICDQAGECYLQDYYMLHGLYDSRIDRDDKVPKGKAIDLGPIVLDQERCVLCSRCVRYTSEVSGTGELYIFDRGDRSEIRTFADRPLTGIYTGNLADVCPVGALTSRDFRFKKRVWFLTPTASLCGGCAKGCNVWMDHEKGASVHRFRPRDNPSVNKLWLCDPGRGTYRELATARLDAPQVRAGGEDGGAASAALDAALQTAATLLTGEPASVALVLSARLTLEDLFVAKKLAEALGTSLLTAWLSPAQDDPAAAEDEILRKRDPFPNTHGAELLGIPVTSAPTEAILEGMRAGRVKTVLLVGAEDLDATPAGTALLAELPRVPSVIAVASRSCGATALAGVVLPAAMAAEREGTWVNGDGRLQRLRKAIRPPGVAMPASALLLGLMRLAGVQVPLQDAGGASARAIFRWIASEVPLLSDITYDRIGVQGLDLAARAAASTEGAVAQEASSAS